MQPISEKSRPDIISADVAKTLNGLFQERVTRNPDDIAYQEYDTDVNGWKSYTWKEMQALIRRWQWALHNEGFVTGDRVAISLRNSIAWVCFDQAALSLGLVVVPLYTSDNPNSVAYILEDCQAKLLLLEWDTDWLRLAESCANLPALDRIVCLKHRQKLEKSDNRLRYIANWLPVEAGPLPAHISDPHVLATLVYTSGTTGRPKGVMLSHYNILWDAEAVAKRIPAFHSDVFLSFLPLAHSFERTAGYYLPIMAGSCTAYARSLDTLRSDLLTIRPTVLLCVPRVYNRVYQAITTRAGKRKLTRQLLQLTESLGWKRFLAMQGNAPAPGILARALWPLLQRLVAAKILARLGGRIRVSVSGGAPLAAPVARFFLGLGLPLTEGYGLTEASPVVSGNTPSETIPGSVGKPLPGVEIRLGEDDELLVRAPNVMLGYWNLPEATRVAVDASGWLHTGDLAEIQEGNIYIRGRMKEILITSGGEKIPPADMELAITADPLFEQAMVIGENRPYLAALLVLNAETWHTLATRLGLDPDAPASLQSRLVYDTVLARVHELLKGFPRYAQVRKIYLTRDNWTIENGLVTPTLKIKRHVLEQRYAVQIRSLYPRPEPAESSVYRTL